MLRRLGAAGVEPLLIKGWAIARLYPGAGLRPYTNLDLIVRPSELGAARGNLWKPPAVAVDLHEEPDRMTGPDPRSAA